MSAQHALGGMVIRCIGAWVLGMGACSAWAVELELDAMQIDVEVIGPLAEITIMQTWSNRTEVVQNGLYVFPLHEVSAVDQVRLVVAGRPIDATVHDRQMATRIYNLAVSAGQTASLTTQERPNVFTQRVGNIPPGEQVQIEISVVQPLERNHGLTTLTLPLALGPRFVAPSSEHRAWMGPTTERIDVAIQVSARFGAEVSDVSSSHDLLLLNGTQSLFASGIVQLQQDLKLHWRLGAHQPQAALLHDGKHALLVIEPPKVDPPLWQRPAREIVWVLDSSASMTGPSWRIVQRSMRALLQTLEPRDRFQIVTFAESSRTFAAGSVPATPANIGAALQFVDSMQPAGRTLMMQGIQRALAEPEGKLERHIVFLSDGLIGLEAPTLNLLDAYGGYSTLSTFAVGPTPNRYVMRQLAELGRGRFTQLEETDTDVALVQRFMETLERPVLTDVRVEWGEETEYLPDLLPGRSLWAVSRWNEPQPVTVRGTLGDQPWARVVSPRLLPTGRILATTWARQHIQQLQDERLRGGPDPQAEGLATALQYGVLSPWTAFVAHDPPPGSVLTKEFVKRIPSGRSYQIATSMAAGVGIGATAAGNANIGGAASNETTYALDGAKLNTPIRLPTNLDRAHDKNPPSFQLEAWGETPGGRPTFGFDGTLQGQQPFIHGANLHLRLTRAGVQRTLEAQVEMQASHDEVGVHLATGWLQTHAKGGRSGRNTMLRAHAHDGNSSIELTMEQRTIETERRESLNLNIGTVVDQPNTVLSAHAAVLGDRWPPGAGVGAGLASVEVEHTWMGENRITAGFAGLGVLSAQGPRATGAPSLRLHGTLKRTQYELKAGRDLSVDGLAAATIASRRLPQTDRISGRMDTAWKRFTLHLQVQVARERRTILKNGAWSLADGIQLIEREQLAATVRVAMPERRLLRAHLEATARRTRGGEELMAMPGAWAYPGLLETARPWTVKAAVGWALPVVWEVRVRASLRYDSAIERNAAAWWLRDRTAMRFSIITSHRSRTVGEAHLGISPGARGFVDPWFGRGGPLDIGVGLRHAL